jgi:aerobic carbon-monoxide dehydrogenase large subunit
VNGDIGGGFGMKTGLIPEEALVAYAAKKLGRPVRWRGERSEEFLAAHMGRDMHMKAALALDADGRILALRLHSLGNMGAVPVGSSAMIPLAMVAKVATSVYRVPVVDYHFQGVLTNTMATGAYRGAGRPEGNYLIERLVEKAGREMGLDPVEIRRRNLLQPGDFPVTTHAGEIYDVGDFPRMLDGLLEAADWSGFAARAAESKKRAGCAAAGCRPTSSGRARCPRKPWTSRWTRRAGSRCSRAPRPWGRGWRRPTCSSSPRCCRFPRRA